MGWQIVRHSFILLFRNLSDALKVSVGPLVIAAVLIVVASGLVGVSPAALFGDPTVATGNPGGMVVATLVMLVVYLFVFAWVAVAWHRFILLEEYPGLLPAVAERPIWPYVGQSILLALAMIAVILPVLLIVGLVVGLLGMAETRTGGLIVGLAVGIVFTYVWLRIAIVLPATAVGRILTIREAWAASAGLSRDIQTAALIVVGINIVVSLVSETVFGSGAIGLVVNLVVTWITLMIGTSLLTTLYGHLIEGRALPK